MIGRRRSNSTAQQAKSTRSVKVVIVGDSGVGKTSLVIRYSKGTFHPFQEPTIGAAFVGQTIRLSNNTQNNGSNGNSGSGDPQNDDIVHLKIWDTAGQERYHSLTPLYFRGAGAAILVFDICRYSSFQSLQRYWIREIHQQQQMDESNQVAGIRLLVIVGNKADLAETGHRAVSTEDARRWATEVAGAQVYMETSAKDDDATGGNVTALFEEIARQAIELLPADSGEGADSAEDTSASGGGDGVIDFSEAPSRSYRCCYS